MRFLQADLQKTLRAVNKKDEQITASRKILEEQERELYVRYQYKIQIIYHWIGVFPCLCSLWFIRIKKQISITVFPY
jgi:hypothetical protein